MVENCLESENLRPFHSPEAFRDAVQQQEGGEAGLTDRLRLYAIHKYKKLNWNPDTGANAPGRALPQDFVNTTMLKFLEGKRKWYESTELIPTVLGAVKSEITNAVDKERRNEQPQSLSGGAIDPTSPEQPTEISEGLSDLLKRLAEEDPLVHDLARLLMSGQFEPNGHRVNERIAIEMGLEKVAVLGVKRRLKRKLVQCLQVQT